MKRRLFFVGSTAYLLVSCASYSTGVGDDLSLLRSTLAPTGTLRIAGLIGAPTSIVRDSATGDRRGVGYEIGVELAKQLGVPFEVIEYGAFVQVADAISSGRADFGAFNAASERAKEVWISQPLFLMESGYLVLTNSRIKSTDLADQTGIRIGVQQNSTSQRVLGGLLKHATVVPVSNLQIVPEMFANGQVDAFATNKGILFDLADRVPGSRVLEGSYTTERQSVAVPKGREFATDFLEQFLRKAVAGGLVADSARRARARGLIIPDSR
jgi:polar amino acid transport system substrate-binding protein